MINNPFITKGYAGEALFCDREKETQLLLDNLQSGMDTVLISPRRYGKSGLILHVFDQLKKIAPEYHTLYTDISATSSLNGFLDAVSAAILSAFPQKTTLGKRFLSFLKGLRPFFRLNEKTGAMEVHLELVSQIQKEATLKQLLDLLENAPEPVALAIDEFQTITEYPEKNVEALLRSQIQHMHNVRFIFCGSKRRMMVSMFNDAARPFYASSTTLHLHKLDRDVYGQFIRRLFDEEGRSIRDDALEYVLEWTRCHTYYTQLLCHALFNNGAREITLDVVYAVCRDILENLSENYLLLREILPTQQWRLLTGIAREGNVKQITASAFISKYKIGSAATALRAVQSLEEKELVLKHLSVDEVSYEVYDVSFSHWLERDF